MSRKFNPGDRVRIVRSERPERVGLVTTVVGPCCYDGSTCAVLPCYELDLPHGSRPEIHSHYAESSLEPYYDGHEKTSWSECEWQPNKIRVC